LALSLTITALLVRGFPPNLGFLADFLYISLISQGNNKIDNETVNWDDERSNKAAMDGGGACSAPVCVLMSLKGWVRGQNPLVIL
jgi:hypothetical protein